MSTPAILVPDSAPRCTLRASVVRQLQMRGYRAPGGWGRAKRRPRNTGQGACTGASLRSAPATHRLEVEAPGGWAVPTLREQRVLRSLSHRGWVLTIQVEQVKSADITDP